MYTQFRKLALASTIALIFATAGATSAFAADSTRQEIVNARQESQIWTTYALSPYLRAHDISVTVDNGKATLTGKVEEDVNKDLAKQIALGVDGIKEVDNQIVVTADLPPRASPAERSYGDMVDDASITSAVKAKLLWNKNTDGLQTDVDTRWARVKLTGTADTAEAKALAGQLAKNTRGVRSVDNQLVVDGTRANKHTSSSEMMGNDISDSWITTKVKSNFMFSSNVTGADISVTTTKGVVELSGKVDSGAERDLAIELAKNVRGVKDVTSSALTF